MNDEQDYAERALQIGNPDGPVPSWSSRDYRRPSASGRGALLAWVLAALCYLVFPLVIVAVPVALRAGRRGRVSAWGAAVVAILLAVVGALIWPVTGS